MTTLKLSLVRKQHVQGQSKTYVFLTNGDFTFPEVRPSEQHPALEFPPGATHAAGFAGTVGADGGRVC